MPILKQKVEQRVDYQIQFVSNCFTLISEGRGVGFLSKSEYSPEFTKELEEIIAGEHIRIPDDMDLLEYIMSLPDEEDNE
jgi:hypothetical protein